MTKLRVENGAAYQPVRAARGASISCKSWQQEAALRMLMNNLDPDVAERPEELIVYGGTGKAARNWACSHAIVESLRGLENDETLLVQSGKPVGIFRTHPYAPQIGRASCRERVYIPPGAAYLAKKNGHLTELTVLIDTPRPGQRPPVHAAD